ncbi:MAG: hypothetical protein R3F43_23480 [bacterium]
MVPTAELPAGESPLKFKAQGVGRLYYGARLRFSRRSCPPSRPTTGWWSSAGTPPPTAPSACAP